MCAYVYVHTANKGGGGRKRKKRRRCLPNAGRIRKTRKKKNLDGHNAGERPFLLLRRDVFLARDSPHWVSGPEFVSRLFRALPNPRRAKVDTAAAAAIALISHTTTTARSRVFTCRRYVEKRIRDNTKIIIIINGAKRREKKKKKKSRGDER